MNRLFYALFLAAALAGCQSSPNASPEAATTTAPTAAEPTTEPESAPIEEGAQFGIAIQPGATTADGKGVATFAGGCFWCMEPPFEKLDGVISVTSGYTGGKEQHPKYKQVASGATGHTESVLVIYDPAKVTYDQLLETYWRSFDPTDAGGQFADRGPQYRPEIFYHSEEQKAAAQASKQKLAESGVFEKPIVVPMTPAAEFWPAEEYHQDYYKKDPTHYKRYRKGSGREAFLADHW